MLQPVVVGVGVDAGQAIRERAVWIRMCCADLLEPTRSSSRTVRRSELSYTWNTAVVYLLSDDGAGQLAARGRRRLRQEHVVVEPELVHCETSSTTERLSDDSRGRRARHRHNVPRQQGGDDLRATPAVPLLSPMWLDVCGHRDPALGGPAGGSRLRSIWRQSGVKPVVDRRWTRWTARCSAPRTREGTRTKSASRSRVETI